MDLHHKDYNKDLRVKIVEKVGTQEDLAKETGIDEAVISKIVRGKREPTIEQKQLISKVLKSTQKDLFGEEKK